MLSVFVYRRWKWAPAKDKQPMFVFRHVPLASICANDELGCHEHALAVCCRALQFKQDGTLISPSAALGVKTWSALTGFVWSVTRSVNRRSHRKHFLCPSQHYDFLYFLNFALLHLYTSSLLHSSTFALPHVCASTTPHNYTSTPLHLHLNTSTVCCALNQ